VHTASSLSVIVLPGSDGASRGGVPVSFETMAGPALPDGGAGRAGTPAEVFGAFLRLGLTSFGGPIAHVAYFRRELVERRKWVGEGEFAQLLALCQFLPGPASSQLGFSLGLLRAGWLGALSAFVAFTL